MKNDRGVVLLGALMFDDLSRLFGSIGPLVVFSVLISWSSLDPRWKSIFVEMLIKI